MVVSEHWKEYIDTDFPAVESISEKDVKNSKRWIPKLRGSVRAALGKILSTEKFQKRRKSILGKPLP